MADKLLIVLLHADPADGYESGAPFLQATVAAAMEYEVELVLSGRAGELARKGVAENLFLREGGAKSVFDLIRDAHEAGVVIKVCTPTQGLLDGDLIPQIAEVVGEAYVISEAMNDDTVTFTY
jgi:uncharacterized protein